ncbi:PAS domain-containing protein [Leptolyngbya sp. KIOST-1]|uniref:PAS domain-containing protein n=1 Tax=Leptolyngbya sp. KIOST-1 TaxID=1229172 RepID=UPI0009DCF617|nr:PAS domain S-box protein [Leptolyngbya sp. KIOST-1]
MRDAYEADNQALMDAIPDLLIRASRDGTYLDIQGRHRFALYQGDHFGVNTTVYDSLPPAEAQRRMQHIQRTLDTGLMQVYEQQLNIDGQLQYEEVRMVTTGADEVLMIIRNITEQKRAEIALRIAEDNYRSIFENAVEGIFQSSPAGHFIKVNPALARIYGYDSPGEMIKSITNISDQLYVDAERRAEFIAAIEQHGVVKDFEYRCYCKDGSIIWTQVDARVVRDDNDNALYYEGIVQDITERKRREDQLRQQLKELQIEIDHQKRAEEVATLTASSYFQEVQQEVTAINLEEFWG